MNNAKEYRKIYKAVLDALDKEPLDRRTLISLSLGAFELTEDEISDTGTNGRRNILRSMAGTVINDMHRKGIISRDKNELYTRSTEKPVALRIERCEEEILKLISASPCTRYDIKDALVLFFGTDETATARDDHQLFTYIGQILKRLVAERIVDFDGNKYSILPARSAEVKSRSEVISLKADFLSMIHERGGEFFEHYFMNLLAKYLIRSGKKITESYVTGGSDDGGIDGVAKTVDSLGFKETIMVQTKNRSDHTSETDVRGFYGAVCAKQGSRGIFATTSHFHPVAKEFLDGIDNCVGVDGDKIFAMATDTSYGIRREGGKLMIDRDVIG